MLNLKVVAQSINNLTDARYFAAYGVDWLGFDINPASENYIDVDSMVEITQWVEGPQFLIEGANWNPDHQTYLDLEEIKSGAVLIERVEEIDNYKGYQIFTSKLEVPGDQYLLNSLDSFRDSDLDPSTVFIKYDNDIQLVQELLEMDNPPGLLLRGGKEQKVGLKAFDQLDEVFDLLY